MEFDEFWGFFSFYCPMTQSNLHETFLFYKNVPLYLLWWVEWECSHWLRYLSPWSAVDGAVWGPCETFGDGALLEEVCHWGFALSVYSLVLLPCLFLWLHAWIWRHELSASCPYCLPCLPLTSLHPSHDGLSSF